MRPTTNTTTIRKRSRRASPQPDYSYVAVGRRGLRPRDQEEQRTQRASFVAAYLTRVHTAAAVGHRAGLGYSVDNKDRAKRPDH